MTSVITDTFPDLILALFLGTVTRMHASNLTKNTEYLFVYGTLRSDVGGEMHLFLARTSLLVGEGVLRGRLYRVRDYPGAVPSTDPADVVRGEVYALRNPGILFPRLDLYEGCGPEFPAPTEFQRQQHEVTLRDGTRVLAWVYVYGRPVNNLPQIMSGDFLASYSLRRGE